MADTAGKAAELSYAKNRIPQTASAGPQRAASTLTSRLASKQSELALLQSLAKGAREGGVTGAAKEVARAGTVEAAKRGTQALLIWTGVGSVLAGIGGKAAEVLVNFFFKHWKWLVLAIALAVLLPLLMYLLVILLPLLIPILFICVLNPVTAVLCSIGG